MSDGSMYWGRSGPVFKLKDIGGISGQTVLVQGMGHGRLIHTGPPADVDQKGIGFYPIPVNEIMGGFIIRGGDHNEITSAQKGIQVNQRKVNPFQVRIGYRSGIGIQNSGFIPGQPFGNGLSHLPHPNDAHKGIVQAFAVEPGALSMELTELDQGIALEDFSGHGDHQPDGQLSRGDGQQVGHNGKPDPATGTGIHIKIVIPFEGSTDNFQIKTLAKKIVSVGCNRGLSCH